MIDEKFDLSSDNDYQSSWNNDLSSLNELRRKRQRMFFDERIFFDEVIDEKFGLSDDNDY